MKALELLQINFTENEPGTGPVVTELPQTVINLKRENEFLLRGNKQSLLIIIREGRH